MPKRFQEMVVMINGGGTGIGVAAAIAFGAEGARIAIGGLEPDELETTRSTLQDEGVAALAATIDVRSADEVSRFIQDCVSAFGRLDVVVNCAGTSEVGELTDMS